MTMPVRLSPIPANHPDSIVVELVEAMVFETPSAASVEFIVKWASALTLAEVTLTTMSSTPVDSDGNMMRSLVLKAGPSKEPTSPANGKVAVMSVL